jgi:hypothetical protein
MDGPACAVAREGALPTKVARPIEEWRIVVKDRYPAYIDWPTYEKIRAIKRTTGPNTSAS